MQRLIDALCGRYGYQATIPNPDAATVAQTPTFANPESRTNFANKIRRQWARDEVLAWEAKVRKDTAEASAAAAPSIT